MDEKQVQSETEKIQLTLHSEEVEQPVVSEVEEVEEKDVPTSLYNEDQLSDEEKQMIIDFSKQIDVLDPSLSLEYGNAAQKKVNDFSESALKNVRSKDLNEIGDLMEDLTKQLRKTEKPEKKGFFDFFKKPVENMVIDYSKAEENVARISKILEQHQVTLLKDIALLDELYVRNQTNIKEVTMYILAGKRRLKELEENDLKKLMEKAQATQNPLDIQAANDMSQAINRFEKKLYDLELTRQIAIQMAPQIRLLQNNDTLLVEKIQSTLMNTIPLWKNQIVLYMGIDHSKRAMEAERSVNNMTNEMLKKNAETLHMATVETAKESERGIVDLETLKHTNEELIKTLDEVLTIQKDGKQKRMQAEVELAKIEQELHEKLLEIDAKKDVTRKDQQ